MSLFIGNEYKQEAIELSRKIRPDVKAQVDKLLASGYNLRTVLAPAMISSCDAAEHHGVDPAEFQAIWIQEVVDYTMSLLIGPRHPDCFDDA
jgi:hypothetical protein